MKGVSQRLRDAVRWRLDAIPGRVQAMRFAHLTDQIRCRIELGFALPQLETMQSYRRLKFLHDCILRFAPSTGVALDVGCYTCSATVFIAKACARKHIQHTYAMDLFTETPSWNSSVDYFNSAQQKITSYGLGDQVTLIRAHSLQYPWKDPIAMLHINANHASRVPRRDIQKYSAFLVEGGIVVFDDYDISHPGVTNAVDRLLAEDARFDAVAANYQGREFGSLCLRRTTADSTFAGHGAFVP
jgi:hypothetical protein